MYRLIYNRSLFAARLGLSLALLLGGVLALLWPNATQASDPKEIYGEDDRLEPHEVSDPTIRGMTEAVGAMVFRNDLTRLQNGDYRLETRPLSVPADNGGSYGLCPDEPFADQPELPFCSAFLVAPNIMVTAGHCVDFRPLTDLAVVFGYQVNAEGETPARLPASQVYFIDEIVHMKNNPREDYAVLRLERAAPASRRPLPFRRIGRVPGDTPVGVIGHPLGLPLKVAFGNEARVYDNRFERYFIANFDASAGNSGSPIINQLSGRVEGIYIYSTVDDLVFADGCWEQNRVDLEEAGQGVFRIAQIAPLIDEAQVEDETEEKPRPACGNVPMSPKNAHFGPGSLLMMVALFCLLLLRATKHKSTGAHQ